MATAQRFHLFLGKLRPHHFVCSMDGFPEWRPVGLRSSALGGLGHWTFATFAMADPDGRKSIPQIVLEIRILPRQSVRSAQWLFSWEGYDVEIVDSYPYQDPAFPDVSTSSLIRLLKTLNTDGQQGAGGNGR